MLALFLIPNFENAGSTRLKCNLLWICKDHLSLVIESPKLQKIMQKFRTKLIKF